MAKITSVKKVPFTPEEQRALKMMSELPYSQRVAMKAEFCKVQKRDPEEVTTYLKGLAQSRRWAKGKGEETESTENSSTTVDKRSICAPKEQVVKTPGNPVIRIAEGGELRIKVKNLRYEGTDLIFTF